MSHLAFSGGLRWTCVDPEILLKNGRSVAFRAVPERSNRNLGDQANGAWDNSISVPRPRRSWRKSRAVTSVAFSLISSAAALVAYE